MTIIPMIVTSDGKAFDDLTEAKVHEICLLPDIKTAVDEETIALWIVRNGAAICDILNDKPTGKRQRKRRSDPGTKRSADA